MGEARRTTPTYSVGQQVTGEVERLFPYGVFVRLADGAQAYIRRRELSLEGNIDPRLIVSQGQMVQAVIVALPEAGRTMELSVRKLQPDPWGQFERQYQERDVVLATVKSVKPRGAFVQVVPGVDAFVPLREMAAWPVEDPEEFLWTGDQVEAVITRINRRARKLRLSIRRRLGQQVKTLQFAHHLDSLKQSECDETLEGESPSAEAQEYADSLGLLGRVLVVDDDKTVLDPLVEWLRRQGCEAEGAGLAAQALACLRGAEFDLVLVDIDLSGEDGVALIRQMRDVRPKCPVAVISIPERIVGRGRELEELGVAEFFAKPLDLREIEEGLTRVSQGEASRGHDLAGTWSIQSEAVDSFRTLSREMRGGSSIQERLEAGLQQLVAFARAETAMVFHMDPVSGRISVVAQAGVMDPNREAVYSLQDSPVKDLICEDRDIFELHVSRNTQGRFSKLLDLLPFESCIGIPVRAGNQIHHALFLFHREPDAFSHYRLRDAWAMATLFGAALEGSLLEQRAQDMSRFLLSGELAAGFGHEVYNKISGLEIQLRNLCAEYGQLDISLDTPVATAPALESIEDAIHSVLDVTLDLKHVAVSFRELTRTEAMEQIDVNEAIRRAELLLRPTARKCKVRITTKLEPDLPKTLGSAARLQQVFSNVMLNAVQQVSAKMALLSNGWGAVEVTSSWELDEVASPIRVRFTDTGPGIHRRLWENIFALGFSTRPGGTGLGLFVSRSIVESMGGRIAVERSVIPMGTTFLVQLPDSGMQERVR